MGHLDFFCYILFEIGVGPIVFTLLDLRGFGTDTSYVLGNIIACILMLYILVYIPAKIIYETQLKK